MGILPEVARGIQAATHQATPNTDDEDMGARAPAHGDTSSGD
jgi:hypothetical protein